MAGIAILVENAEYADGLYSYLISNAAGDVSIEVYTDPGSFLDYLDRHTDSTVFMQDCFDLTVPGGQKKILTTRRAGEDEGGIYMYKDMDLVSKQILAAYKKPEKKVLSKGGYFAGRGYFDDSYDEDAPPKKPRIICVCTPFGGTYASTYAYALAKYYSKGESTLFISFDPFFGLSAGTASRAKAGGGLGRIIYLLDKKDEKAISSSAVKIGEVDCVFGTDHWTDLCDMTERHIRRLLNLIEDDYYDVVVIDMKFFGAASVTLLKNANRVIVPTGTRSGEEGLAEWTRQLRLIGVGQGITRNTEVPFDGLLHDAWDPSNVLKGRLGKFLEETEGLHYVR